MVKQANLAAEITRLHEIEPDLPSVDGKVHTLQTPFEQEADSFFSHPRVQDYAASGELAQTGKRGKLAENVVWQRLENGKSA
jgi:hypothetical protein